MIKQSSWHPYLPNNSSTAHDRDPPTPDLPRIAFLSLPKPPNRHSNHKYTGFRRLTYCATPCRYGFVPNYAGGGAGSWDRTEPPVGSRVLLELHRKYGDDWLVEACFDDLLGEWRSVSGAQGRLPGLLAWWRVLRLCRLPVWSGPLLLCVVTTVL